MPKAVFVPGLLCNEELFASQIEALSGAFEITIGDHRSDDNFTSIATRILSHAPEKFVYAGLSMGGYAGLEIMRQAPERVEALILMNTSARADAPEKIEQRKGLIAMAQNEGLVAVANAVLPNFLAERHHGNKEMTDTVHRMASDTGLDAFLKQQVAIMGRADSQTLLSAISCPTLVIVGADDTLTPPELAIEITEGIANAELAVIENCGHLSTIEQPGVVSDVIKTFLKKTGISA